jgi:hypothetical protein
VLVVGEDEQMPYQAHLARQEGNDDDAEDGEQGDDKEGDEQGNEQGDDDDAFHRSSLDDVPDGTEHPQ